MSVVSLLSQPHYLSHLIGISQITPYAQQAALLRRTFGDALGAEYERLVEVNTVDAFQGREANIGKRSLLFIVYANKHRPHKSSRPVIFSCVRAAGSKGIGFLSDVRRMNVALTRAKNFFFVIARCSSIIVNPYWRDLVEHARETDAVIEVPFSGSRKLSFTFPDLSALHAVPANEKRQRVDDNAN